MISENVQAQIELACGAPAQDIQRVIREQAVQLVAMGKQERGFIKDIIPESVSHDAARFPGGAKSQENAETRRRKFFV